MPQPPNLQKMLEQAQKMMDDMPQAQEELKDERVEASAGGGMVKVVMTGDRASSRSRSTPTRSTPRTSRCCRTWSSRPSTRRCARPRSCGRQARRAGRGLRPDERARRARPRRARRRRWRRRRRSARRPAEPRRPPQEAVTACSPRPLQRLVTELAKLPGVGGRTAQRLAFHILRASAEDARGAGRRDPRGQGADRRCARSASTSPRARAARSAWTSAATPT